MYSKLITVTPAEAVLWLATRNSRNRPIKQGTVDRYAQEMKSGNWRCNGETLIFGKSGNILNGQHRLKACVQSGCSFETLVVYGVEDAVFDTIDDNERRSMPDVLAIQGESNPKVLGAALRFLWMYGTGQILAGTCKGRRGIATKKVLEQTLKEHPGLRSSAKFYSMLKQRAGGLLLPASQAVGLHYLFALVNEAKADEFFTTFQSGFSLQEGHPIALLRARLIAGQQQQSNRLTEEARYYYTVTAWNAFFRGQPLKRMAISAEKSPDIEGLPKTLFREFLTSESVHAPKLKKAKAA